MEAAQAPPPVRSRVDLVQARYGDRLVLVVDDAPLNVKIMVKMLEGIKCVSAYSGVEAVNCVRKLMIDGEAAGPGARRLFDLILTDVIMPGMDGLQAAMEIRKLEDSKGLPRVPIVAVSANALSHDREVCRAAGLSFLSKPCSRDELYRMLDTQFLPSRTGMYPPAVPPA